MVVPLGRFIGVLPSTEKKISPSSQLWENFNTLLGENIIGRVPKKCGDTKTISIHWASGSMIGPPADRE